MSEPTNNELADSLDLLMAFQRCDSDLFFLVTLAAKRLRESAPIKRHDHDLDVRSTGQPTNPSAASGD